MAGRSLHSSQRPAETAANPSIQLGGGRCVPPRASHPMAGMAKDNLHSIGGVADRYDRQLKRRDFGSDDCANVRVEQVNRTHQAIRLCYFRSQIAHPGPEEVVSIRWNAFCTSNGLLGWYWVQPQNFFLRCSVRTRCGCIGPWRTLQLRCRQHDALFYFCRRDRHLCPPG